MAYIQCVLLLRGIFPFIQKPLSTNHVGANGMILNSEDHCNKDDSYTNKYHKKCAKNVIEHGFLFIAFLCSFFLLATGNIADAAFSSDINLLCVYKFISSSDDVNGLQSHFSSKLKWKQINKNRFVIHLIHFGRPEDWNIVQMNVFFLEQMPSKKRRPYGSDEFK